MKIVRNGSGPIKKGNGFWICSAIGCGMMAIVATGCSDDNNRVPTKIETKAADANRQSYIDKLNIPESQKAIMKSHMGGPPAASPMDAAKEGAQTKAGDDRRR